VNYASFIRVLVVCPQVRHVATRYGSRENPGAFGSSLSVRISILTAWGVS